LVRFQVVKVKGTHNKFTYEIVEYDGSDTAECTTVHTHKAECTTVQCTYTELV